MVDVSIVNGFIKSTHNGGSPYKVVVLNFFLLNSTFLAGSIPKFENNLRILRPDLNPKAFICAFSDHQPVDSFPVYHPVVEL